MPQVSSISPENPKTPYLFQNKEVDNDGFFQTMEEGLSSMQGVQDIWKETRLELFELSWLLADMKKQKYIHGITEWTASEQRSFFQKVQSEVVDAGIMASSRIKEKIQWLIEDEIWREINDGNKKVELHDGDGNTMISNMGEYQQFLDTSFLFSKETSMIPLNLRLTISEMETIVDAKKKLARYSGKYNALVLVDNEDRPIGVVKTSALENHEQAGNATLKGIYFIPHIFGYYTTSSQEAKDLMQGTRVNILPIVDSNTGILIGILTDSAIVKKELHYYSATSLTELSLDYLKNNT